MKTHQATEKHFKKLRQQTELKTPVCEMASHLIQTCLKFLSEYGKDHNHYM